MELLTKDLIQELLSVDQAPSLSLYMPTHRTHPENLKDRILFSKLVKQMEESLLQKYSADEVQKHLEPIKALANDKNIWNYALDGLAIFSAKEVLKVVKLHQKVGQLAMVADSFHTKPLWKYLQSANSYHVLCLTRHNIQLFKGNRHSLSEIELTDNTPKTITEALGDESYEKNVTISSYGGIRGKNSPMYHGHDGRKEETKKDTEKFFNIVADAIYEHYSKPLGWPLILAALPEHHNLFQQVNKNPFLLSKGIYINPSSLSTEELADMAWEVMEPEYNLKLDNLAARFKQAKANGTGSDQYKEVAAALVKGRVDTLIVEAGRIIPLSITNLLEGNTDEKDITNPTIDDLLDDMGELTIEKGGEVMVFPTDKMPTKTGLAAIFRY